MRCSPVARSRKSSCSPPVGATAVIECAGLHPEASQPAALLDLLYRQRGRLPLEAFCRMGGWPDEDGIELTVESMRTEGTAVAARVTVRFTERISTGCSTSRNNSNAGGVLAVRWVPDSGACSIAVADRSD